MLRNRFLITCTGGLLAMAALLGCGRDADIPAAAPVPAHNDGSVSIAGDDAIADALTWRAPVVDLGEETPEAAAVRAAAAQADGRLFADGQAAIPIYLALLARDAKDSAASAGLARAMTQLLADGDDALRDAGDDAQALRRAHAVAAVVRTVGAQDKAAQAYLERVDRADRLWDINRQAEAKLLRDELGEGGGGALAGFREALALQPRQPRALQGVAAVESALIRRAEVAAEASEFKQAQAWLDAAAKIRPGHATVTDARGRIAAVRRARIDGLRDEGVAALLQPGGIPLARKQLATMLQIAQPGDAAATDLRERIDLATHYGLFRPGQVFTDALQAGARGPQMRVVPHGGFTMGARPGEAGSTDAERPRHYVRFERGFAMAVHEVSVGEFRRFIDATGRRTRAQRRGYSMAYDERTGNFVRSSGVDWSSDHAGRPAGDDLPVLHVSAADAQAYAEWLSSGSSQRYRLPSEAEFEYALRAGGDTRYPWGAGAPPRNAGNFTGAGDRSPNARHWANAFAGYGDGHWGAAPVGSYAENAFGIEDLAGNVSEWVADCWHDGYRRAPVNGDAWINPGCQLRVVRGGSWASSPDQSRSAWRAPAPADTSNARVGFRVVREL